MTSRVVRLMARWLSSFVPRKISSMPLICVKRVKILFIVWKKYRVVALIRKDFYSYTKMFTGTTPVDNKAHLYQRRFFNEDGSVAL